MTKALILRGLSAAIVGAMVKTLLVWTFVARAIVPVHEDEWAVPDDQLETVERMEVSLLTAAAMYIQRERAMGIPFPTYLGGAWLLVKEQLPTFVLDTVVIFCAVLFVALRANHLHQSSDTGSSP
jgi:hypothetical protein